MRNHRHAVLARLVLPLGLSIGVLGACQKGSSKDQPASGSGSGSATATAASTGSAGSAAGSAASPDKVIDSTDILGRTETSQEVHVKHVLLGWKELAAVY